MTRWRPSRGASLVELLIVVVVLALLGGAATFWYTRGQKGIGGKKTITAPREKAREVDCANNMRQVAMALGMASTSEDRRPTDLREALRYGATEKMLECPQSHQPYRYDANQALVICDTPGHGSARVELVGSQ